MLIPKSNALLALALALIAISSTDAVLARSHHRARTTAAIRSQAQNVPEQSRDPADIALDRKIKGIFRGC
jgi:hypothetical protein